MPTVIRLIVCAALVVLVGAQASAAPLSRQASIAASTAPRTSNAGAPYVSDELLVRFRVPSTARAVSAVHARHGAMVLERFRSVGNLERVRLPAGASVEDAAASYAQDPSVLYAEPNYLVEPYATPNDTRYLELWGLNNLGQSGGTPDADIDAAEAWNITTGSSNVIVAVIDTGMDVAHADLAANIFVNASECTPNGLDDDGNGVVDDCHGFDAIGDDGIPEPDSEQHATHVAGTIGARGNNALGVVGVNWDVRIIPCRFINNGSGRVSDAVECLDYVAAMKDLGHNIVATNNSWGGGGFSRALIDAIDEQRARGILFIAAAGNAGTALSASYPAGYYLPNVISVAATTRNDALADFSNYGRTFVHLGAPGQAILSTVPGGGYASFNGTSMAAPHVTGVAALLKAQNPARDWRAIRNLLLTSGDTIPALAETVTGKRLNANGALTCAGATVESRVRPIHPALSVGVGQPVPIAVLHATCAAPAGDVTVTVTGEADVVLHDDGTGFDQEAGDGVYSGTWTASAEGTYTLSIAGDDVVVHVGDALPNPTPEGGDLFGFAIAANDDWIVVGEALGNDGGRGAGAVHVFDALTGLPVHTLVNPTPDYLDYFGSAVAIDGNLVLVGAPYDDTSGLDAGIAYVFDAATGALVRTIPSPTASESGFFGYAVTFVDHNALIGAPSDSGYGDFIGAAFLFDPFVGTLLHTFLNPDNLIEQSGFGFALAARGTQAVISAVGQSTDFGTGYVHVMEADPGSLDFGSRILSLRARAGSQRHGANFGWSVAVAGNDIVVGDPYGLQATPPHWEGPGPAPATGIAYLMDGTTGLVKAEIDLPDYSTPTASFGWAIAVSGDYILITAYRDTIVMPGPPGTGIPYAGAAYVFEAATGAPIRRVTAPIPHLFDDYGYAAAPLGGDFLIGAIADDMLGLDAGMVYRVSLPAPVARAKCYQAKVASGAAKLPYTTHTLADGIETKTTSVQGVATACGPASQNGSSIPDAGAYLTCRRIKDAAGQPKLAPRDLRVLGPLGMHTLTIKKAEHLCLASGRDGSPIPALDHYKCYQAKTTQGTPKLQKRTITLADELQSKSALVTKPVAFCAPVRVDGSSLVAPETTLACYQLKDAAEPPFARPSFAAASVLGTETLATVKARTVCVPTQLLQDY